MADRVITPPGQRHFIEPFDQRVFQFDTDKSDVFLSRVANSVYQVLGNDIVMYGLEVISPVHTSDSIQINLSKGAAIQDQTLIITPEDLQLEMTGISSMDESGRIVVMSNYNYLETFEENRHSFNLNYVNPSGNPLHSFMNQRDRMVLGILEFTKDSSDNVNSVSIASETFIVINGKEYHLRGYSPENKRLTAYLIHQLLSGENTSIQLDPTTGLKLVGDTLNPGNSKFYGTNQIGSKGWFDISSLGVDNESIIPAYQDQYNQVLFNGNLFFISSGHSINYELYPFWQLFNSDLFWTPATSDYEWLTGSNQWAKTSPTASNLIRLNVKSGVQWAFKYRPLKFKILDISNEEQATRVTLFDTVGNIICEASPYASNFELLTDFSNENNIGYLEVELAALQNYFSGIQFFGGTPGGIL